MALNDELIKKILTKLTKVYPKNIEKMKEILPDYEDQEEVCEHLFHLRDVGCVDFIDLSSKDGKGCCNIKLTPMYIERKRENALSKANKPTKYFPPDKNIIVIEKVTDSQIQIDSPHATQIKKVNKELTDKLEELSKFIKENIEQLKMNEDNKQELQAEVQTIDIQLSSPKLKRNILKPCISSIRRILEGATGQIIALQIIDKLVLIEKLF